MKRMIKTLTPFLILTSVLLTSCSTATELDLSQAMNDVKTKIPTVQETRIYTESTDPNNSLGKPGSYIQAAAFWDTRTEYSEEYASEKGMWGTDAGGSIEVYNSTSDAKKRIDNFSAFADNAMFTPGAFDRIDNIVIRASKNLSKSEQDEVLAVLKSIVTQ